MVLGNKDSGFAAVESRTPQLSVADRLATATGTGANRTGIHTPGPIAIEYRHSHAFARSRRKAPAVPRIEQGKTAVGLHGEDVLLWQPNAPARRQSRTAGAIPADYPTIESDPFA